MNPETIQDQLTQSLSMFAFLALELTLLFLIISYAVGVIQQWVTPEKVRSILSSKNGRGYLISAVLGSITPFCSCSTIPFLKGLLRAKAGFGPTMVFLIASPLLNPIIIGLFVVTFGWQVSLFYFITAMAVSVSAGYLLEALGFERFIKSNEEDSACGSCEPEPEVSSGNDCCSSEGEPKAEPAASSCCESKPSAEAKRQRWITPWHQALKDFKTVLPYLLVGIGIGSLIYGFVPTEFIAKHTAVDNLFAVPISAIIGIPLYVRAEAVIPLSAALVTKGMSLGAAMALIIGSAGASLTEVILLRSLFKTPIIIAFLIVVLGMAIVGGYTLNLLI
ncbi:permease [Rubritalea marina]|uniref:permease n=1 Tax=Rubritalea marina TaxID=361055 RepID=UPI00037BD5E9|nr:permease [Rubritalea marina]